MSAEMTAGRFVAKWSRSDLPERAAAQEHFIDLCRLLGQPTPAEHDPTGEEYTFEKGVAVTEPYEEVVEPEVHTGQGDAGAALTVEEVALFTLFALGFPLRLFKL